MKLSYLQHGKILSLEKQVDKMEQQLVELKFRLSNIGNDDAKVAFYTGFPSHNALKAFYNYLRPAVDYLCYSSKQSDSQIQ